MLSAFYGATAKGKGVLLTEGFRRVSLQLSPSFSDWPLLVALQGRWSCNLRPVPVRTSALSLYRARTSFLL
jgi:hypothetical protein